MPKAMPRDLIRGNDPLYRAGTANLRRSLDSPGETRYLRFCKLH